jgi:cysteine desulfurase/selenocysteine lyase
MPIDIERARRDTPAASEVLHFNNAGAALMPAPVLQAQLRHLQLEAEAGGYEAAAAADDRIEAIYDSIGRLLNADRAEIALVENATVAWDMAFYSVGFAAGDRILTAEAEYLSNYIAFLQVARRSGAVVDVVPSDEAGELDVEALERMIDRRVKLIAITHVPTNGGLVNPAAAIGRIARAHGILYLLDACQSVGQMPIDVAAIGCDMLSATGRKYLRGPRGRDSSMCGAPSSTGSSRPFSICRRRPGPGPTATRCARTPAASRTGNATSRDSSASAPRSTTRSAGVSPT